MFVTKTALSRRTVLKGFGTALALPFLDAMTPAFARGQERAAAPLRFGGVYVPNGAPIGNSPTTTRSAIILRSSRRSPRESRSCRWARRRLETTF